MEERCYICGVAGFKELLGTCIKCKSTFIHPYCMKKVEFIVPDDWMCEDCEGSDEAPVVDEATVLVSRFLFSKGKKHLASPEKPCNGAEMPKKGVEDLTITDRLATLRPRGEKLSKGTLAGQKRRKKHHVHADLEPVSTHVAGKKHLASPENSCNGSEIPKKGVADSTNMNRLATLRARGGGARDARADFGRQMDRTHKPTRWYCDSTSRELGMTDDMEEAFGNIQASSLLTMDYPSYPALTSEFLATIKTNIAKPSAAGYIRFHLGNRKRTISLEQLNFIFGLADPTDDYDLIDFSVPRLWGLLTGQGHQVPAKDIASPLFRVILRILGNTIWARKENSRPTHRELACVLGMLFEPRISMNLGFEFLMHILAYKNREGELYIGGMIARIAEYFGVDFTAYSSLPPRRIDRAYLLASGVIENIDGVYHSKFRGCLVPITPPRMDLMYIPNWYATWACAPFPLDATHGYNPATDPALRAREPRYAEAVDPSTPVVNEERAATDEQMGGDDDTELDTRPTHAGEGASSTMNADLCAQMGQLRTDFTQQISQLRTDFTTQFGQLREHIDSLMSAQSAYFEEQRRIEQERWARLQEQFMTWTQHEF